MRPLAKLYAAATAGAGATQFAVTEPRDYADVYPAIRLGATNVVLEDTVTGDSYVYAPPQQAGGRPTRQEVESFLKDVDEGRFRPWRGGLPREQPRQHEEL